VIDFELGELERAVREELALNRNMLTIIKSLRRWYADYLDRATLEGIEDVEKIMDEGLR
jgi:hypothetical protein